MFYITPSHKRRDMIKLSRIDSSCVGVLNASTWTDDEHDERRHWRTIYSFSVNYLGVIHLFSQIDLQSSKK